MTHTYVTGGVHLLNQVNDLSQVTARRSLYEAAMTDPGVTTLSLRAPGRAPMKAIADLGYEIAKAGGKKFAFRPMAGRNAPQSVIEAGPHYEFDLSQAEFPQQGTAMVPLPCEPDGSPNVPLTAWFRNYCTARRDWLLSHPDVEIEHCMWPGRLWAEFDLGNHLTAFPGNSVPNMLNTHFVWWEIADEIIPQGRVVEFPFSGHGGRNGLIAGLLQRALAKPDPQRYQFQMNGLNNINVMWPPGDQPQGPPDWCRKVIRRGFQMVQSHQPPVNQRIPFDWSQVFGTVMDAAMAAVTDDQELHDRLASETTCEVYLESFVGNGSAQLETMGGMFWSDQQDMIEDSPVPPDDCEEQLAAATLALDAAVATVQQQKDVIEGQKGTIQAQKQDLAVANARIEDMKSYVAKA